MDTEQKNLTNTCIQVFGPNQSPLFKPDAISTATNISRLDQPPFFSQSANSVFACDKFEQTQTYLASYSFQARLIQLLDSSVAYIPQMSEYFDEIEAEKEEMGTELKELIEDMNKNKQKKAKIKA